MRLFVAHKCGKLLEYVEGSAFVSVIDSIDDRANFLFVLFRRPLFDDTRRLAEFLAG